MNPFSTLLSYRSSLDILSVNLESQAIYYVSLYVLGSVPGSTAVHHLINRKLTSFLRSVYWLRYLQVRIADLETHFLSLDLPPSLTCLPPDLHNSIQSRNMLVRRLKMFPIESIVRVYITGTAWAEYSTSKTVSGIPLPAGLGYRQKLPTPLWTPSTKAEIGDKDEDITQAQAYEIVSERVGRKIEELSLEIYSIAAKRTEEAGIILADTKFEFRTGGENIVLADEALTPDSSRFWVKDSWEQNLGQAQPSLDKQYLRDWLLASGLKEKGSVMIPENVVMKTAAMYHEACKKLMK